MAHAKTSTFLNHSLWDDGKAEVSIYDAKRPHYGQLYASKVEHFLVKENFSLKELVKSDDFQSDKVVAVLKLNQVISTPTGTYDYQQMHSGFWKRETGALLKFAVSHHEACGATYKQGKRDGNQFSIRGHTYWQGESKIHTDIPLTSDIWFYDELPLRARLLIADQIPAPDKLQLVPSTIHSKAGSFQPVEAQLTINNSTVTLKHSGGCDILKFDPEWPHVLQSWQQSDGGSLILRKTLRLDYWNHHSPGDEHLVE